MGYRTVTGTINKNFTPWVNTLVRFKLVPGSYTANAHHPSTTVSAYTNALGYFEVELWANEEGLTPSVWSCQLPDNKTFTFSLPSGTGPLDLSVVRAFGQDQNQSQYASLLGVLEAQISAAISTHNLSAASHPNGIAGSGGDSDGGLRYQSIFTDADLSIEGVLVKTHNLNIEPSSIRIVDPTGEEYYPDRIIDQTTTVVAVAMESFRPLLGTWELIIGG